MVAQQCTDGSLRGHRVSLEIHFGSKQTSLPRQRPTRSKQRSARFSRCARSQTEVCFASTDVRGAKQRSVCFSRCARSQTEVCFASADVRGLVQGVCTLQPMCAAPNRGLFDFNPYGFRRIERPASDKTSSIHPPFLSILTVTHIVRASAVSLAFTQHPIT